MITVIEVDGNERSWGGNGGPVSLETVQHHVGGDVRMVVLPDQRQLCCDEDGLMKELPVNPRATELVGSLIVGTVVILSGVERLT